MNLEDMEDDYEGEEDVAEQQPAPEPEEKEAPQTVPLAAHIEERNKLKARIDELEARNSRFSGLEAEIREMRERLNAKPEPEPEPEPDYFEDPKAYIDKRTGSLVDRLKQLDGKAQQYEQQLTQQQQVQQMMAHVVSVEKDFAKQQDDYYDALNYMREIRRRELTLMFPQAQAGQIETQIQNEEMQGAAMALQSRRNPAEVAYKLAQARGYQRKQAPPEREEPDLSNAGSLGSSGDGRLSELVNAEADEFDIALREMFG